MISRRGSTRFRRLRLSLSQRSWIRCLIRRADIREEGTWLTGASAWIEYFGLALSVHHSATAEPSGLTAFESVFRNACQHVEWTVDPPGSRTRRFVDPTVQTDVGPERRLSLKSTAAKDLKEDSAHISKLTEAD